MPVELAVGFVSLELYPTTVGGAGIFLHHAVQLLLADGINVVLLLDLTKEEFARFEDQDRAQFCDGSRLLAYRVDDMAGGADVAAMYPDREQARSVRIAAALAQLQALHRLCLVEFYDYCGPAFHYLARPRAERVPVAVRLHNTTELIERRCRNQLPVTRIYDYAMERGQLLLADYVLTPGKRYFDQEILPLYRNELAHARVVNSSPPHFPIGEFEYSLQSRSVMFYGRLSTFKGLDVFLRAAALALRDRVFAGWVDKFIIVGPEETVASSLTLDEMKAVIPSDCVEKFVFSGRIKHDGLMAMLPQMAFACFANRMESFCYAAHELHTAGLPLVLSDTPAFRDHFHDGHDAVFFDTTARGLAAAMIRLASNHNLRQRLSRSAAGKLAHYTQNHYRQFLPAPGEAGRKSAPQATLRDETISVFVLSDGNSALEFLTINTLWHERVVARLLRLSERGPVRFAGSRWEWTEGTDQGSADPLGELTEFCAFFRAGDEIDTDVLLRGLDRAAEDGRVGAVAFWQKLGPNVRSSLHAYVPELAQSVGPGVRTLIRIPRGLTVLELMESGSVRDETSLLLEVRAQGRVILEMPEPVAQVEHCVALPAVPMGPVGGVDFDRMSREYLAIGHRAELPVWAGARESAAYLPSLVDADRAKSLLQPGWVKLQARPDRTRGEVWVLRLFKGSGGVHEPWNMVTRIGHWQLVVEPLSPAGGALKTESGILEFWGGADSGIEILRGPFCGSIDIVYGGHRYAMNLRADTVYHERVRLSDLERGIAASANLPMAPSLAAGRRKFAADARALAKVGSAPAGMAAISLSDGSTSRAARSAVKRLRAIELELRDFGWGANPSHLHLAGAIEEMANEAGVKQVILPFGMESGPNLAQALLRHAVGLEVVIDVDGMAKAGGASYFPLLANWIRAVSPAPQRAVAIGGDHWAIDSLAQFGVRPEFVPHLLPPCPEIKTDLAGHLDLVLIPSQGAVDNMAHMVAAAAVIKHSVRRVRSLYLPAGQYHMRDLAESLGAARWIVGYNRLAEIDLTSGGRVMCGCAVYPDPVAPSGLFEALELGILCVVGPGGFGADPRVMAPFVVPYWEDSQQLAAALVNLAGNYNEMRAAYNAGLASGAAQGLH